MTEPVDNELKKNVCSGIGRECCNPGKICHTGTWEQLFDALPDPVLVVRPDGIIIEANSATLQASP